jgi:dolichyl-phosphate-mannose-protein mannosyltransferase
MRAPSEGPGPGPLEASIFVEALRANPAGFVFVGLAVHALLWTLVPLISEATPDPRLLVGAALGRELQLGYADTPPLAPWLTALVHWLFGINAMVALGPLAVALAGWLVFKLGREIVGERHAAIATLIMVGVHPVAFPVEAFDGNVLSIPLAALAVLAWWRAVRDRSRGDLMLFAAAVALLAYAGAQGLFLFLALSAFAGATPEGRAALSRYAVDNPALIAAAVFLVVLIPRLLWLALYRFDGAAPGPGAGVDPGALVGPLVVIGGVVLGHVGLLVLIVLGSPLLASDRTTAPTFVRPPLDAFARRTGIVIVFAPALVAAVFALVLRWKAPMVAAAPLLLYSGLLAIMLGGDVIKISRQRAAAFAAIVLLVLPPVLEAATNIISPWVAEAGRPTNFPAAEAARRVSDAFRARTGLPLRIVAGDTNMAAAIALYSADRPRFFPGADSRRAPWTDEAELRAAGAVVVWLAEGPSIAPPVELAARLPGLVPEAPLSLPWARPGRLDPVRVGWAILPPAR